MKKGTLDKQEIIEAFKPYKLSWEGFYEWMKNQTRILEDLPNGDVKEIFNAFDVNHYIEIKTGMTNLKGGEK